jgi:hypothetical protein
MYTSNAPIDTAKAPHVRSVCAFLVPLLLSCAWVSAQERSAVPVIRGKVIDAEGKPVSGANAFLMKENPVDGGVLADPLDFPRNIFLPDVILREARTQEDGEFSFPVEEGGSYGLRVSAEGFATRIFHDVQWSPGTAPIQSMLAKAAALDGRLVSASDEKGVPGAWICVLPCYDYVPVSGWILDPVPCWHAIMDKTWAESGPEGRFQFQNLAPGSHLLAVRKKGFGTVLFRGIRVPAQDLALRLEEPFTLRGRVLSGTGKESVPGARVVVVMDDRRRVSFGCAVADSDGRFRIEEVLPGTCRILITAPGHWKGQGELRPSQGATVEMEFSLPRGIRVTGIVKEMGTDKPMPGVRVSLAGYVDPFEGPLPVAETDAEGRYVLDGVASERWHDLKGSGEGAEFSFWLGASKAGWALEKHVRLDAEALQKTLEAPPLLLKPACLLRLTVLDPLGRPLPGASTALITMEHRQEGFWPNRNNYPKILKTDAAGKVGIGVEAGSKQRFWIHGAGYAFEVFEASRLDPGSRQEDATIRLKSGGAIEGQAVEAAGKPARGYLAYLSFLSDPGGGNDDLEGHPLLAPSMPALLTDSDGRFRIAALRPGRYELTVLGPDGEEICKETGIRVEEGKDASITARILDKKPIEGVVVDQFGNPVDASVYAEGPEPWVVASDTNEEGRFFIEKVIPGEYVLHASTKDGSARTTLKVKAGDRDVRIVLAHTKASFVEGIVVDEDGIPYSGVWVLILISEGDLAGEEKTREDGKFCVRGLKEGEYTLRASVGDGVPPVEMPVHATAKGLRIVMKRPK